MKSSEADGQDASACAFIVRWKQRRLQAARYPRLHSGLPRILETLEALGRARKEEAGGKVLWRG